MTVTATQRGARRGGDRRTDRARSRRAVQRHGRLHRSGHARHPHGDGRLGRRQPELQALDPVTTGFRDRRTPTPRPGSTTSTVCVTDDDDGDGLRHVHRDGRAGHGDRPVADDDADTTTRTLRWPIFVLTNDVDPEGDLLEITAVTQPADGTVVINDEADPEVEDTVTYTPALNFFGTTTFTYTVDDGNGHTATATVTVTVAPVNDEPVVTTGADAETVEGSRGGGQRVGERRRWSVPVVVPVGDPGGTGGVGGAERHVRRPHRSDHASSPRSRTAPTSCSWRPVTATGCVTPIRATTP